MGKKQGLNNLTKGFQRELTQSELSRGYLFISKDKEVIELLKEGFNVFIDKVQLKNKKLDNSGRTVLGKQILSKFKDNRVKITLKNNSISIN